MKNQQRIWPAEIKRTRQREKVLSVFEDSEKPLSATDIYSIMEKNGDTISLSTIYRILDLFVKKDIVIKTTIMNSEMAVFELNRFKHKHYAVCMECQKITTMDNCPMEKFIPNLADDFHIVGHNRYK